MGRSWAEEKSFYPLILCLILLLHGGALFLKWSGIAEIKMPSDKRPLIVRIESERKQIVQSEDSESDKVKDDSFLSDKNRYFDRQTRARVVDKFKKAAKKKGGKKAGSKDLQLSDLGSMIQGDPFEKAAKDYTRDKNGSHGDQSSQNVSSTNDHIKDIPPGDITNLNTVEYKYYGFYHRIRQKLEQFWGRSLYEKAEEMIRQGRRIPASEELITALVITLNQEGEIIDIYIKGSSGIKELDDAAIESFNQAGPFPNPPKDLIVNGKVTLEWGFVVQS